MLESVDAETAKQIGFLIGTIIAGAALGAVGVWKSKRGAQDDTLVPVTKADLRELIEQDRSVQLHQALAAAMASFEKDAKSDRTLLYGRIDAIKADLVQRHSEFEQRWLEYVRDQKNKHDDHDERLRTVEVAIGPGGARRR